MATVPSAVRPHGGRLVRRVLPHEERREVLAVTAGMRTITLNRRAQSELLLLALGAYSPLEGFMGQADYRRVVEDLHLESGLPWTIPITLAVSDEEAAGLVPDESVVLADRQGVPLAVLRVSDCFPYDKGREALWVYGTQDPAHPGVHELYRQPDTYVGGSISLLNPPQLAHSAFLVDPARVREQIARNGWRTVVGFQTRNPLHRAHEYLQKCALEMFDGLLLHPLVGPTREGDLSAEVRLETYQVLLERYYPRERVLLAVFPAAMRYAGPREAVFHALVRKNYGCSHFIVGRDHAGVGDFYGPYDAQRLLEEFGVQELGITPLFFENAFYCRQCAAVATSKTCPHEATEHVSPSGTEVRRRLAAGRQIPAEVMRPEVARILARHAGPNRG